MANPVIENIAANIAAAINQISTDNGYNQDLTAVRPTRNDFSDTPPVDGKVLIWQGDENPPGAEAVGTDEWLQDFLLVAIVRDSDDAATSIDTRLNQVRGDIVKKLMTDTDRGGYAVDTAFGGSWKFDDGEGFTGITVRCIVHYRYNYGDPYTQA